MTINNRAMHARLCYLERCADTAPTGTYRTARDTADLISSVSNRVLAGAIRDRNALAHLKPTVPS